MSILKHLSYYPPRYGPEWGSGGIFGLKYHRGLLYYTLAFEALSYFIADDGVRLIYDFNKVGGKPASGGDTYNAVEVVDDKILFGGWVHAPAVYRGRDVGGSTIDFRNKYSHVHVYNTVENTVDLIWKESIHDPEKWVGEISEIIYDPYSDKLLLARADGHVNLGVYELDYRNGFINKVLEHPGLKGSLHLDYACFAIHGYPHGFKGVQCLDLIDRRKYVKFIDVKAIDKHEILHPHVGVVASAYGWLFTFIKGGVVLSDVTSDEHYVIRLFDIPYSQIGPMRTKGIYIGGGVLVAYNMYSHSVIHVSSGDVRVKKSLNTIISPSIILYITPPQVKIVSTMGARITSIESVEDKILVASNTMANTGRYDASPFDQGYRGFTVIDQSRITYDSTALTMAIPGWMIMDKAFGGIPVHGYRDAKMVIHSRKENKLCINEYVLTLPPSLIDETCEDIHYGRNIVDLARYSGILSFKFEKPLSEDEYVVIDLK